MTSESDRAKLQTVVFHGLAGKGIPFDDKGLAATLRGIDGVESVEIRSTGEKRNPSGTVKIIGAGYDASAAVAYIKAIYQVQNNTVHEMGQE